MALTFTFVDRNTFGKWHETLYKIALDNSYTTGGYAISATKVGLGVILGANCWGVDAAASGVIQLSWDYTNGKLMAFRVATFTPAGTIAAPTINISGGVGGTVAIGISSDADAAALSKTAATSRTGITGVQAPAFTGTAQGQVALAQVSNAVDLSAVTARIVFLGNK